MMCNNGMKIRLLCTLIYLYIVSMLYIPDRHKYIIIIVGLVLLDSVDNRVDKKCDTKTFEYQSKDKIVDIVSYIFLLPVLKNVSAFLYFLILYRIIGVFLFIYTKKSYWLIVFFDFIKEYLFFLALVNKDQMLPEFPLLPVVLLKVGFEYYHHQINNKKYY